MIHYSLTKDRMNPEKGGYIAKVKQWQSTDLDDILDYMVAEGTGLTRPQALAYFEKLMQTFEHFIELRGNLTIPLFHVNLTITGVFTNEGDSFDSERHQLNIRITPGPRLNKLRKKLKLKKEFHPEVAPTPNYLIDFKTKSKNGQISPGSIATLKGKNLKFDSQDFNQGIFFIPEDNSKTRIRVETYAQIRPSEINFSIPLLQKGNYTVIVQTIMRRHISIRTGVLRKLITVI